MIRSARQRAGPTQSALATRARTSAPTISAYEHGTRHPNAATCCCACWMRLGSSRSWCRPRRATPRYIDLFCDALADRPDTTRRCSTRLARSRTCPADNVRAWRTLLRAGPAAVVAVLTSRDPDVRGLKAANPFARLGLIDEDTRLSLLDQARGN